MLAAELRPVPTEPSMRRMVWSDTPETSDSCAPVQSKSARPALICSPVSIDGIFYAVWWFLIDMEESD